MNQQPTIKLNHTIERSQNIRCGHAQGVDHIFLASGFHFHIPNQMDAGERSNKNVSHIGVGADMDQVIESLINPKSVPNSKRMSRVYQPFNNLTTSS